MTRSAFASPPRVLHEQPPAPRESDNLLRDREYATFCSISLASDHQHRPTRHSLSASGGGDPDRGYYLDGARVTFPKRLLALAGRRTAATAEPPPSHRRSRRQPWRWRVRNMRGFIPLCLLLLAAGLAGLVLALVTTADADRYLFLGAVTSLAFSLVVVVCYLHTRIVRSHPNPLIFSKSLVDLILAGLYIFQYAATEFAAPPLRLPPHLAALTQALLVCGEFWFFAMPMDMVQSITNPFTSYAHNNRVYWFYSTLSGAICGLALWVFDDDPGTDCGDDRRPCSDEERRHLERFFWFHENTDSHGFWWHHWASYHLWVLVYLIFATVSIIYVKRRLHRGLEETFDVRRRVLSSGLLTCWIYVYWSLLILCLFVLTNLQVVRTTLSPMALEDLVNVGAFLHAARGGLNIIVWLVINASNLEALCFHGTQTTASRMAHRRSAGSSFSNAKGSSTFQPHASMSTMEAMVREEQERLVKPELNTALRKQIIQMATNGIVESVEHYHRLHRRIESNQTFDLDWQRSPHRELRQLSSSMSLTKVAATRNATIRVVEANERASSTRFTFLPMSMKEMQFFDFQPKLFASIRQSYAIDDAEYVYAFRNTMNERISEGRSGAFVFLTSDRKYLVKSTTAAEKRVLLDLLPSYQHYLKWNPQTLLPRFFGFHAMKMYGQTFYFVVMGNVLNTPEIIHRRYDIKGSWVDRNAPACVLGEKYRCSKCNRFFTFGATGSAVVPCDSSENTEHYPDITLRDNDLKKRLKIESNTATMLVKQLIRDSDFLASLGIMDYSLLIGTHYSHFTIAPTTSPQAPTAKRTSYAPSDSLDLENQGQSTEANEYLHVLYEHHADIPESSPSLQDAQDAEDCHDTAPGNETEASTSLSTSASEVRSLPVFHGYRRSLTAPETTFDSTASSRAPHHRYKAHQVSGPSIYYFGLVDILQKWTIAKQCERMYKVHVLRKDGRGVSAIAPKAYAARFQQKMKQLFVTITEELPPPSARRSSEPIDGNVEFSPVPSP